jgi:hypothetical protein
VQSKKKSSALKRDILRMAASLDYEASVAEIIRNRFDFFN